MFLSGSINILQNLQIVSIRFGVHLNFKGPKRELVNLEYLKYMYKKYPHLINQYIIYLLHDIRMDGHIFRQHLESLYNIWMFIPKMYMPILGKSNL